MKISVIIPVYNAASFVEEAVKSALVQPEIGEVLLINDGSTDGSLAICERLSTGNEKVRLLHHEDGKNHGAGASRNLGIAHAQFDWIAFLDADDYYLENRFKRATAFLQKHPECDGVAEAIGAIYEDDIGKEQYLKHLSLPINTLACKIVTGMRTDSYGKELFEQFFLGKNGYFSLIGLMIRKECLIDQPFEEAYPIAQDTHFIYRIIYKYNIKAFNSDYLVAKRRIHKGNRWNKSLKQRLYFSAKINQHLYSYIGHQKLSKAVSRKLVYVYVRSRHLEYYQTDNYILKLYYGISSYFYLALKNPALLTKAYLYW